MERCVACNILFPSKYWLDKHKLSPQHVQMQQLMDTDHNYAIPLPFYISNGSAGRGIGRKTGSSSVSAIQR